MGIHISGKGEVYTLEVLSRSTYDQKRIQKLVQFHMFMVTLSLQQ